MLKVFASIVGLVIAFVAVNLIMESPRLKLTNIKRGGDAMFFVYQNPSSDTGDYVFWIKYKDRPYCETILKNVLPNEVESSAVGCEEVFDQFSAGEDLHLMHNWAKSDKQRAAAAGSRIAKKL